MDCLRRALRDGSMRTVLGRNRIQGLVYGTIQRTTNTPFDYHRTGKFPYLVLPYESVRYD